MKYKNVFRNDDTEDIFAYFSIESKLTTHSYNYCLYSKLIHVCILLLR